jgi:arginyl-tRNA synthetase
MAQITSIESLVLKSVQEIVLKLYQTQVEETALQIQETRKEFEGDLTVVVFPLLKYSRKTAEATATDLGNALLSSCPIVEKFNVIKGFLNLVIGREFWAGFLQESAFDGTFGTTGISETSPTVMIEYSSPNTNKPLHLGHIRNNLLGYSLSQILSANGKRVIKVNLVNDRGIHICKSMLAWKLFGKGKRPPHREEGRPSGGRLLCPL